MMTKLKEERVEVLILKDFPEPHGRTFISVYERSDGHVVLKPTMPEVTKRVLQELQRVGMSFFIQAKDSIIVAKSAYLSKIKPLIMSKLTCYSSSKLPTPEFDESPKKIVPKHSKVSVPLPDSGEKVVFNYTPAKIVPKQPAMLSISCGNRTITLFATRKNLKAFLIGLKDCIKMIINIERQA